MSENKEEAQETAGNTATGAEGQGKIISIDEGRIKEHLSVRRVEDITQALWGTRVSPSVVSDLNQKIYGQIEEWRNRPIEGRYAYVYLDGVWLKRS